MLAAHRDQENNYFANPPAAGASKQLLQAKTPGTRFPKTPLKVPLNDENANRGFGGKSVLGTKGNNENALTVGKGGNGAGKANRLVTPAEPRTARAPLGNKTTNAKARATQQTGGVKEITRQLEKTSLKPTSTDRPKQAAPQTESSRLQVHAATSRPVEEEDIEYAPPKPKDLPYESDVCPDGVLTFEGLKPENLFNGFYQYYFNKVDENGLTAREREVAEQRQRHLERGDEQIRKDMEEFDWSIGDLPESKGIFNKKPEGTGNQATATAPKKPARGVLKDRQPPTIAARNAASALALPLKSSGTTLAKTSKTAKPVPSKAPLRGFALPGRKTPLAPLSTNGSRPERTAAVAASRSTLGYSKGRSASSAVHGIPEPISQQPEKPVLKPRALARSASTASSGSDATITPARFAKSQDWKKPDFLSIFDAADDDDDGLSGGTSPFDDFDDDFQLSTDF